MNFPKELLYISRNMNLVRSLNKFHGGVADRIPIMAKAAYFGSQLQHSESKPMVMQKLRGPWTTIGKILDLALVCW